MIYDTDVLDGFATHWHVSPPAQGGVYVVVRQEWSRDGRSRHIHAWRYADVAEPDTEGWLPVPSWWRAMA